MDSNCIKSKERSHINNFDECKIISLYKSIYPFHTININLKKYLNGKTPKELLYGKILKKELSNLEPNSPDTIVLLMTAFLLYGENSTEYKNIYDFVYKGSEVDKGWSSILFESFASKKIFINPVLDEKNNFLEEIYDPNCYKLLDQGRIVLLSDWAIGTPSAIHTLKCVADHKPDYFIHLGDVYYSGTIKEFKNNLIDPLTSILPKTKSFILPGNHDYYSGTEGLHYALKEINQTSSFFSLYNDSIQIEGLDTGFNDSDILGTNTTYLQDTEYMWHKNRYQQAKSKNRKIILLSHHQIISNVRILDHHKQSPLNHKLFKQTSSILNRTMLWFFGHDHAFNIFEPYTYKNVCIYRARLIGNGSCQSRESSLENCETENTIEFKKPNVPIPKVKKIIPGNFNRILNNSYVVIDYTLRNVKVTYYEIPMISLGVFDSPKILFYEEINF